MAKPEGPARAARAPKIDEGRFPRLDLPLPVPYPPMEARRSEIIPEAGDWLYEPKWDGFRALVFRDGDQVAIQSKAGQPLGRYFPELVAEFRNLRTKRFILDGEIVVPVEGKLSFDDLLLRIHPAESRVRKLSEEIPAEYFAFDLLYEGSRKHPIASLPIEKRRELLERFFHTIPDDVSIKLSPATPDRAIAEDWFRHYGQQGLDGVIAKRMGEPYRSGEREGMVKIKRFRTADCVVGGFRLSSEGTGVGSLLLGLYDDEGNLRFVGHTSSFNRKEREELEAILEPKKGDNPFAVRVPGGPSRWASERSSAWEPLRPELVCEVQYDYFNQGRFRHGTKFIRWRPEKKPESCTIDQAGVS